MSSTTASPAAARCRGTFNTLLQQCDRLEQLDHIARSTQAMATAIEQALQPEAASGGRLSLVGRAVLFTGWIPRRVGKAPENTRAQANSREDLTRLLADARASVARLESRLTEIDGAPGRVNHFAFGDLTARRWLDVIRIHTNHHLKIIADIQRATAG
jgi:hypothetical protein